MRWTGNVARTGDSRYCTYRVLVLRPEGKSPLGRCSVDKMIILKWMFMKWDGKERTELIRLRILKSGRRL
jgi:hypothetical protein